MTPTTLMALILVPLMAALLVLPLRRTYGMKAFLALAAVTANLVLAIQAFRFTTAGGGAEFSYIHAWATMGIDFSLRLYQFSGFITLAIAGFAFLVTLYSVPFMKERAYTNQYYGYLLLTVGAANGAALADNMVVMLFFWEALLGTLFGMIAIGRPGAWKSATKALLIQGVTDVCLMLGVVLTAYLASQQGAQSPLSMLGVSKLHLAATGLGGLAFVMMMIGAIAKAGSMPFHSWIPDAALDSPLPFMAILPASIEKLLGIYLLARVTLDLYHVESFSWASYTMMTVGGATILLAVAMALIQKDYKKLLSYHAVSQVGYMVMGVGSGVAVGVVGGLFHMINHAMYKSCLFLSGGSVEKQTGTTDLSKLGGLARQMPVTFACFFVAAASISGVPPFNGFFSKELVYDGALKIHWAFYAMALGGSFLTAASFLKLGHAAYLGKRGEASQQVKESPLPMLVPMIVIAGMCVLFGLWTALPLKNLIEPVVVSAGLMKPAETFAGIHMDSHTMMLWGATVAVLLGALLNHLHGAKKYGSGIRAVDHIHHAPVLSTIYDRAEKRWFDPYDIAMGIVKMVSALLYAADRVVDWVYDRLTVGVSYGLATVISKAHDGNYSTYIVWSLAGAILAILFVAGSL